MSEALEQVAEVVAVEPTATIFLNCRNLHAALSAVDPTRSNDVNRPILTAFHISAVGHVVTITTTDSYVLTRATYTDCEISWHKCPEKWSLLFGLGTKLTELKSVLGKEQVRLEVTAKTVTFSTPDRALSITLNLVEGDFPHCDNLLDPALERASNGHFAVMAFNGEIFAKVLNGHKAFCKIAKCKPAEIPIHLRTTDPLKPAILHYLYPDFGEVTILLMPVRVN